MFSFTCDEQAGRARPLWLAGLLAFLGVACAGPLEDPARFEGKISCEVDCDGIDPTPSSDGTRPTSGGSPSQETTKRRLALVKAMGCASCHGETLSGPPNGRWAPNLTPDPSTGLGLWSAAEMTMAIRNGTNREGRELCGSMPLFSAKRLSEADLGEIVAYLRALPAAPEARKGACE